MNERILVFLEFLTEPKKINWALVLIRLLHLTSHLMVISCKMSTGGGFTASSSPNCEVYVGHLSGKKNKSTSYNQGIMSKLILYDENIWIHFVCLQRLGLDVGDKF